MATDPSRAATYLSSFFWFPAFAGMTNGEKNTERQKSAGMGEECRNDEKKKPGWQ
jgi:hypothetical protein